MTPENIKTNDIEREIKDIISFPEDHFIEIIREVGFECNSCGKCCTSEFNDHVFLLDEDAERIIEHAGKDFLRPAPYYEFCDNKGRFYVMGYALKNKSRGHCIFYTGGRCEHYDIRPLICRIYPYTLHREADEKGNIDWRHIAGLNQHGFYYSDMNDETSENIVKDVKKYEIAFLEQKLRFMNSIRDLFKEHSLRHSQQMYDKKMREFEKGKEIEVFVFFQGKFEKETVSKPIIIPG
ncbi:MAG: YkgJ family cysteine cluster protein [Candidatus Methanoperedens sp.]|nr:YkgJ family cysteine cluster protein [Candidatus Methanoperedens sp.]MCZ7369187.1 YkgJ family cysteine cluster protein [Candidatus Methanoperedens sp.]